MQTDDAIAKMWSEAGAFARATADVAGWEAVQALGQRQHDELLHEYVRAFIFQLDTLEHVSVNQIVHYVTHRFGLSSLPEHSRHLKSVLKAEIDSAIDLRTIQHAHALPAASTAPPFVRCPSTSSTASLAVIANAPIPTPPSPERHPIQSIENAGVAVAFEKHYRLGSYKKAILLTHIEQVVVREDTTLAPESVSAWIKACFAEDIKEGTLKQCNTSGRVSYKGLEPISDSAQAYAELTSRAMGLVTGSDQRGRSHKKRKNCGVSSGMRYTWHMGAMA